MKEEILEAFRNDRFIDITTTGRKTGLERRIEITAHVLDGRVYISGRPGTRGWYANLLDDPSFTVHLKQSLVADLPARAEPITDLEERRRILKPIAAQWGRSDELEAMIADSPLIEVHLTES